jgi:hypothetical protein
MLLDPRPNLELGLAAFSLLPVLFSPLFAENRPELWHRPPSVPPQDQRKLLAEIDRTGRLLPRQGPGRHRVRYTERRGPRLCAADAYFTIF